LFLREIRLMRSLAHPHVLPILDFGETPERIWFTTPFLATESVAHRIDPAKPLPAETVLRVGKQVAQALQFAHEQKGIIHRDLKPANILLDAQGNAQLSDFGLARRLSGDSILGQSTEHRIGTAAYMSPAVASGSAWEIRDDIYALGAVLYEMLTGHPPYEGETHEAILQQIKSRPPRPMLELNRKCPSHLAAVVEAAMARTVRDRYTCIADLAADLERVAAGRAPLGPRGQWRSWHRWGATPRRRGVTVTAALAALSVLALIALERRPTLRVLDGPSLPGLSLSVTPGDWDGDRRPELYTMDGNSCSIRSQENKPVHRPFVPAEAPNLPADSGLKPDTELTLVGALNVDRDASDDFVVHWWQDGELLSSGVRTGVAHAASFNADGFLLGHYSLPGTRVDRTNQVLHTSSLRPYCCTNLTGGPGFDLIVGVHAGFNLRPRGIACFAATGLNEMRWPAMVEFASSPMEPAFADTNRDGRIDTVFVGTCAPDNGNVLADGTDDAHAWLYALSATGHALWRTNLADKYAIVKTLVVQSNGLPSVSALISRRHGFRKDEKNPASSELPELGELHVFAPDERRMASRKIGVDCCSALAVDLDGDGRDEVLVTDRFGRLHFFDAGLRPLRSMQVVDPLPFHEAEITNLHSLLEKLGNPPDQVSAHLRGLFSASGRRAIAAYPASGLGTNELKRLLVHKLNATLRGQALYDTNRFRGVALHSATAALLASKPRGSDVATLNRLLLEDAFPQELSRNWWIKLELVGCAPLHKPGRQMIVLVSRRVIPNYDLALLANDGKQLQPEIHTQVTVHVLPAKPRLLWRPELRKKIRARDPSVMLADWDGDGFQEIVALGSDRIEVLELE
jgi:hypothetical protein